ncbi:protein Niban 1a [Etheostoma cragini]|uniref:protein Niban 1a n=1 Tax=Etheostoma cragini TaxID=417921 RepID=UPI00155DFBD8|nr:protein Niban 1a [Etheostoma cragini]
MLEQFVKFCSSSSLACAETTSCRFNLNHVVAPPPSLLTLPQQPTSDSERVFAKEKKKKKKKKKKKTAFVRGSPPRLQLLPTGGAVLTSEEAYMALVDQCFPDETNVKEDFAPPLSGMPGQFPVYLRLPYRTDSYFCFTQQDKQAAFISILSDCIRHQNQDFLKKRTCEVQAFLKAVQLYRQDRGRYEAWGMLIGSDVRVMANEVMEQLLPSLQIDLLPRLKAKKTEKRRVWFATVEAAYVLVQEHLLEGLSALKEDCRASVRQQEVLMHSDMDQILSSRRQLEDKVRGNRRHLLEMVKEATSLKKFNLFTDSRDLLSQSSRSSLSSPSPSVSTPGSPAMALASPSKTSSEHQSRSPLALDGLPSCPPRDEQTGAETGDETVFESPLQKVEQPSVVETPASADSTKQTQEVNVETAPEDVVQEEVVSVKTAEEPQRQSTDPPTEGKTTLSETPTVVESIKTQIEAPVQSPGAQTASSSEEETHCEKPAAPSGGQTPAPHPPADIGADLSLQEAEPVNVSGSDSLDVSVGSASSPEGVKTPQTTEENEVSTASDVLEDAGNVAKSPESSDDSVKEAASAEPSPGAPTSPPAGEAMASISEAAPDCIKQIRDLVMEVFEVEELVQRYPDGVPKVEE